MSEILLVNPRRRRRRKMSALQRKFFGGKRRKARASNPKRRRKSYKKNVYVNPRRRRRSSLTRSFRRRSNPSLRNVTGQLMPMLKAGGIGAVGALGLDLLWGYGKAYLPAQIAGSPLAQYATKLLGALAVGILGGKVLRGKGSALAVGATTVVLHDALKAQLQTSFPTLQLGEYLTYAPVVGGTMQRPALRGVTASRGLSGVGQYMNGINNQEDNGTYSGDYDSSGMNGW